MIKSKKDEQESYYDEFEESIDSLLVHNRNELNETLNNNRYIFLLRYRDNLSYYGMNFNELEKIIDTISKNPEISYDHFQDVVDGKLVGLIDGSQDDPQIKFICSCNYIRDYIEDNYRD